MSHWPQAGVDLWSELRRTHGRFALLAGPQADLVAGALADLVGAVPLHVGQCLTASEVKPHEAAVKARITGHPVLVGIQVLFDSALELDPVRILAQLAKVAPPILAVWPVPTGCDRLTFPPGVAQRRDTTGDLRGCLLLTTQRTIFADEVPFTAERFS